MFGAVHFHKHTKHRKGVQKKHSASYETTKSKTRSAETYFRHLKSQSKVASRRELPPAAQCGNRAPASLIPSSCAAQL